MATTLGTTSHAGSGGGSYDMSLWYDSKWYKFGMGLMLLVACFWIWFQRTFAYSHGMDSMEPEFERVWMGLWRAHMIIMPLFALANAGVALGWDVIEWLGDPVTLGVIFGLVVGKQVGITSFVWLAVKSKFAELPKGVTWLQVYGTSWLAGIGFTMSLFIAGLAL